MPARRTRNALLELLSTLKAELGTHRINVSAAGTLGAVLHTCGRGRRSGHGSNSAHGLVSQAGKASSKCAAHANTHAEPHAGTHEARRGTPLIARSALHNVHAALLLIVVAFARTLPGKRLGLDVHLGGVTLRFENAPLALNLHIVDGGKILFEGLDAVEREIIERETKLIKIVNELALHLRREVAQIRRDF